MSKTRIRAFTLGVNIRNIPTPNVREFMDCLREKILPLMEVMHQETERIKKEKGIEVLDHRISLSPISTVGPFENIKDYIELGIALDELASSTNASFIGGFSAYAERGVDHGSNKVIEALPEALKKTKRLCGFINVASYQAGINMEAVKHSAEIIKKIAESQEQIALKSCARFSVTANLPAGIPFMPSSYHNNSESDIALNIGMGGLENINRELFDVGDHLSINEICKIITNETCKSAKRTEEIGLEVVNYLQEVVQKSHVPWLQNNSVALGGIDISLSPLPHSPEYSILQLFRSIGVESFQTPGSLAILSMVNDALKRGGLQGSNYIRGFSGSFISVSEDGEVFNYMSAGNKISLDRLMALTCICSVGIDMLAIPDTTSINTIAGIIADEMAIGNAFKKAAAVRLLLSDKPENEMVKLTSHDFLGKAIVAGVEGSDNRKFIERNGFIPPPIFSFTG